MAANVGSVEFSLRARADQLGKDIKGAMKLAQRRLAAAGRVIGKAVAASLTVATAAIAAAVTKGVQSIDQLAKESDKLGIAIDRLQLLRQAADLTGVASEKLGTGLQRMVRRVAEAAQGTGEAVNALKELNLNAVELNRLSPDEVFLRIGEAMQGVSGQSDRIRLAMKLFDSEGVGLVNTLKLTRGELQAMNDDMQKLGVTIDRQTAAKVENAKDQFTRLGTALTGVINQLTIQLAPIAGVVAEILVDWSKETGVVMNASRELSKWVANLITGMASLSFWANKVAIAYNKVRLGVALATQNGAGILSAQRDLAIATSKATESIKIDEFTRKLKEAQTVIAQTVSSVSDFTLEGGAKTGGTVLGDVQEMLLQFKKAGDPWAEMKIKIKQTEEALSAGFVPQAELVREKLSLVKDELAKIEHRTVKVAIEMTEHWQSFAFNATSAIDEFVETGRLSMKSFVRDVIQDFAKIQLRNLLFGQGSLTGGIFGGIAGALGISPTKTVGNAMGGHLEAGQASYVGERGIEKFVPDVPGTIIPHNQTRRMMGEESSGNITVEMNFASGVSRQELARESQNIEERVIKGILTAKKNGGSFGATFA